MFVSLIFNLFFIAIDIILTYNLWTTWLDATSTSFGKDFGFFLTIILQFVTIFMCVLTCYCCKPRDKRTEDTGDRDRCPMYCLFIDCRDCGECGDCGDCGGLECIDV